MKRKHKNNQKRKDFRLTWKEKEEDDVEDELVNQFNNTMNLSKRRRVRVVNG